MHDSWSSDGQVPTTGGPAVAASLDTPLYTVRMSPPGFPSPVSTPLPRLWPWLDPGSGAGRLRTSLYSSSLIAIQPMDSVFPNGFSLT